MNNYPQEIRDILKIGIKEKASDVHFSAGHPPILRIDRNLVPLTKLDVLSAKDTEQIAKFFLSEERQAILEKKKTIELSYQLEAKARFRTSIFYQRDQISIAMRLIPSEIGTIESLGLPLVLHDFANAPQGFVIVTGPSSHGKTTTLASTIEEINKKRSVHIITIEDPIEYYFEDKKAIIDQREIGRDTRTFAGALRASFRQDPDVLMVGEMRDKETMATALAAAETGHLVFSTLHTNSAAEAVHRIVNSFPAEQQSQIRTQLSTALLGIISQRLVPRIKGGLIPACEILVSTPAIANLIRENKIYEIPMVIETSGEFGMLTLNKSLANLVRAKEISFKNAIQHSIDPNQLRKMAGEF